MEMTNAKRKILDVSLELFSRNGYEATTMGQIADALGIKKPSLYSHFAGKQEIFDTLIAQLQVVYAQNSMLSQAHWDDPAEDHSRFAAMTPREYVAEVQKQVAFLLHDERISKVRKLFIIEQFRNPTLGAMEERRSYTDILTYHVGLMDFLVKKGILIEAEPEVMALQYIAPISLQLYRMDRDPACRQEAMEIIEKHILQFFRLYRKP